MTAQLRPRRSCLAVPGSNPRFLEKAKELPADQVFLDLEDACAPLAKPDARKTIVAALNEGGWEGRTRVVRVNDWTSQWTYRDVVDVVEGAGAHLDCVMLPKVQTAGQVVALDLPRTDVQGRIRSHAEESAGRAHVPARIVTNGDDDSGADLLTELPAVAHWLGGISGRLVLGNYCYADGAAHVRVSMAADALAQVDLDELVRRHVRVESAIADVVTSAQTLAAAVERHADADPTDYRAEVPLGRMGTPDDVAQLVTYLASDAASFVTGQRITVNGGHTVT